MSERAIAAGLMILLALLSGSASAEQRPASAWIVIAAGGDGPTESSNLAKAQKLAPEELMEKRYPQPARAGDLIGLPLLDWHDRTIGRIRHVVRTPDGKLQLVVTYGGFLGWRQRLVPVPIEVVAIAGRQLSALDMTWADFDRAPTWNASLTTPLAPDDIIRIALYRR